MISSSHLKPSPGESQAYTYFRRLQRTRSGCAIGHIASVRGVRLVAPRFNHAGQGAQSAGGVSEFVEFRHELVDLGPGGETFRQRCVGDVLHGEWRDELNFAVGSRRLDDMQLDIFEAGLDKQSWQTGTDVGIPALSPHGLGVELYESPERRALRIAKTSSTIDVFHDDNSAGPQCSAHSCQSLSG